MKTIIYILNIIAFSLASFSMFAADKQTAESSRQFNLVYFTATSNASTGVNIDLNCTYKKDAQGLRDVEYNIKLDAADSFKINEPANFSYFYAKLYDIIKKKDSTMIALSVQDAMTMYYWITGILSDESDDTREAGELVFNSYVRVYNKVKIDFKELTYEERNNAQAIGYHARTLQNLKTKLDSFTRSSPTTKGGYLLFQKYINDLEDARKKLENELKKKGVDSDSLEAAFIQEETNINVVIDSLKLADAFLESYIHLNSELNAAQQANIYLHRFMKNSDLQLIKNIQLQFERGFLEKIQVIVEDETRGDIVFENLYPIGFSSRKNFSDFQEIALYERKAHSKKYIFLAGVINNYINYFDNYTRDFSPADTAYNFIDPLKTLKSKVYRSPVIDILDIKIYTDLLGLNANNPNGLIQTELQKRFNLYTSRTQFSGGGINLSKLSYITVIGTLSKFEQKNRYLPLRNEKLFVNGQLTSPSYATTLDFMRYESMSFGAELNGFNADFPDAKFTFSVNVGARYSVVPVTDSVFTEGNATAPVQKGGLNPAGLFTWYPRFKAEVFAERRYGISLAYQINNTRVLSNNEYKQVHSYQKEDLAETFTPSSVRWSSMFELYGRYEPNRKDAVGKVFVRLRLHTQHSDQNTHFAQMQVGYAFYLNYKRK